MKKYFLRVACLVLCILTFTVASGMFHAPTARAAAADGCTTFQAGKGICPPGTSVDDDTRVEILQCLAGTQGRVAAGLASLAELKEPIFNFFQRAHHSSNATSAQQQAAKHLIETSEKFDQAVANHSGDKQALLNELERALDGMKKAMPEATNLLKSAEQIAGPISELTTADLATTAATVAGIIAVTECGIEAHLHAALPGGVPDQYSNSALDTLYAEDTNNDNGNVASVCPGYDDAGNCQDIQGNNCPNATFDNLGNCADNGANVASNPTADYGSDLGPDLSDSSSIDG